MTNDEIELIKCYFVSQCLRCDAAVLEAKHNYLHSLNDRNCLLVMRSLTEQATIDKIANDLYALLNL